MATKSATADTNADEQQQQQAKYKANCDKYVDNGLKSNRRIQFLIQQLDKMGCTPPAGLIRCTDCGYLKALGAFHLLSETKVDTTAATKPTTNTTMAPLDATQSAIPQTGSHHHHLEEKTLPKASSLTAACSNYFSQTLQKIGRSAKNDQAAQDALMDQMNTTTTKNNEADTKKVPEIFLCQQHLADEGQAHRTIIHELIHAVDTCRTKMDPQHNCIHLACTEIRAENLSSDCNFFTELQRIGPHSLQKHGQECVKRRAMLSVSSHPRCRDRAEEYVDAAMGRCYKDVFPFDRHPNEGPEY